ncbi:MAG: riboflavin kinase / adenylyltransferase [Acidobacteriota bacterium]|jgi:riboflavin kinase/FMN adenylyltransferase|nr:riboflavin kinase / adenylyltransferase [Acidobacteriota bacterium]
MLVFSDPLRQTDLPRGCVATIGNFDGMHVGHQQIVRGVVDRAREMGRPSAVITFHPHPLSVVAPDRVPKQILTLPQKEELLRDMGVDAMLVVPFSHEFSRWTADRFIEEFLVTALDATEVRIGRDFCFGAGREGNLEKLHVAGRRFGFAVQGVDDVKVRGIRVSSSLVRDAIARGAMHAVTLALGRTYFIDGRVATGRRLGRKMGFPTVNVDPANDLFPSGGVFVTTCRFESFSRSFEGVTNVGVRPTLYENYATTIESHILDFDSNVYGDTVRLYFHALLRREQQFRSALELTNQIRQDITRSRRYFLRHPQAQIVTATPDDVDGDWPG